jgi:hypothetical protein
MWNDPREKSTRMRAAGAALTIFVLFSVTACDLWIVSRLVTYTTLVEDPPIAHLAASQLRQLLQDEPQPVRLLAPGANLPNVLSVSSTPVYLTFGPAEYEDPDLKMPPVAGKGSDAFVALSPGKLAWLRRAGVTHVLSEQPLDLSSWPAELVWQGVDPVLNRAWNRAEPLLLYRLRFDPAADTGRVRFAEPAPGQTASVTDYKPDRAVIKTSSPGPARLILTDLMYPGWKVSVDGVDADAIEAEGMFRAVDLPAGTHTIVWSYRPLSLYLGAIVSALAILLLAAIAHIRYWHPGYFWKREFAQKGERPTLKGERPAAAG